MFFWRGTHSVFQWHSGGVLLDIFRLRKPENENWDPTYWLCLKGFSAGVHGLLGFGGLGFGKIRASVCRVEKVSKLGLHMFEAVLYFCHGQGSLVLGGTTWKPSRPQSNIE